MRTLGAILAGLGLACIAGSLLLCVALAFAMGRMGTADAAGAGMGVGTLLLGVPIGLVVFGIGTLLRRLPRRGYTAPDFGRGLGRAAGAALAIVGVFFGVGALSRGVGKGPDPQGESAAATGAGVILSLLFALLCLGVAAAGVFLWRRFRPPVLDESTGAEADTNVDVAGIDARVRAAEERLVVHRCPACKILNRVPDLREGEAFTCRYCGETVAT